MMIVGKFLELKKEKDNKEAIYYIHFSHIILEFLLHN